jgi:hypothetical protein
MLLLRICTAPKARAITQAPPMSPRVRLSTNNSQAMVLSSSAVRRRMTRCESVRLSPFFHQFLSSVPGLQFETVCACQTIHCVDRQR